MVALLMRLVSNFLQKLGIAHMASTGACAGIKLFEHSEQHHGDDQPHAIFENH
jgi:hypothetical protein